QIAKDAKEMGVEIINANPDSAIESFPKCNVSDLIELNPPKMLDINIEKSRGALNKYKTLQEIHKLVNPNCYLEIGVDRGKSLKLSNAPITIGIDANPKITSNKVRKTTSEKFFKNHTFHNPIDLCFIDSNHLIEDVLYDFIQVEKNCTTNSVIIIDDVAPAHPVQANRVRVSIKWAGDVWKLHRILQKFRPDLSLKLLDTSPTGMLVVTHLDPKNKTLENKYNELISKVKTSPVPDAVIERAEAIKDLAKLELFKYKQKISIGEQLIKTGTEKIIIKNDDMQKDYKIGVVTPTCSPERKPFLEFLEKRIYGQTKQVDKWYLVNYPNNSHIPDLAKRYKQGIKKAVEDECDLIFLMEDDDYYPYTYIEELFKEWKKKGCPTIIGVNGTVYFHLKHDGYASFPQNKRTSAFETAITSNAIYDQCPDHVIDYDIKLWKANQPDGVLVDIPHRPVGIKHGLGLTGGRYHTKGKYNTNKPPQMQLKNLVDEEAYNFYQKIKKNL
ncbi:MAG: class I SAM-dependent methyltransferase, partial [archaeon]